MNPSYFYYTKLILQTINLGYYTISTILKSRIKKKPSFGEKLGFYFFLPMKYTAEARI